MAVFLSYSSRDVSRVEQLASTLRRAREEIWYDSELGGGDAWWRMILDRIRDCDVFLVALSRNLVQSKACQLELQYAQALGKPILPVQVGPVDSMRTNPLAATQVIDFQNPTLDTGIELVAALDWARKIAAPLPDPLPDEPQMPFAYLMRIGGLIAGPTLSAQQQTVIAAELRAGLDDDGDDPSARADIMSLLRALRDRSDVTYRTRAEIDSVLAALNPPAPPPPPMAPVWNAPPPQSYSAPPPLQRSSKKGLFIGGGVAAVAFIAVVAIVVATSGGESTPTDSAAPSSPASEPTAVEASPRSLLLTPDEVSEIMGTDTIEPKPIAAQMDFAITTLSKPECLGASYITIADVYRKSGYTGVAFQVLVAKGYDSMFVGQGVVEFPSVTDAAEFVNTSGDQWSACAGDTVTMTVTGSPDQQWTYKDVDRTDDQIVQQTDQIGTGGYGCSHVVRRDVNMIIETMTCRTPPGDESVQIADKISAKIDAG